MHSAGVHPLLQQTPLSVNPFIDLPKAPTLPHNYASLPSTLPPSCMNAVPVGDNDLPAYVTSTTGFAAHPSTILKQNKALLDQLAQEKRDAREKITSWEKSIGDRELQEKRRKAPGWLDSESKLLEPTKAGSNGEAKENLLDAPLPEQVSGKKNVTADDLGAAMDRAFGRSEMG